MLLLDVLTTLCQDPDTVTLANITTEPIQAPAADPRMARVLAHLHNHFAEPVSIGGMAELACISPSAFHRMFRRHTRMTMVGYINRLRIGRACSMLIESAMPVATIAADVGFTNLLAVQPAVRARQGRYAEQFPQTPSRHACDATQPHDRFRGAKFLNSVALG